MRSIEKHDWQHDWVFVLLDLARCHGVLRDAKNQMSSRRAFGMIVFKKLANCSPLLIKIAKKCNSKTKRKKLHTELPAVFDRGPRQNAQNKS